MLVPTVGISERPPPFQKYVACSQGAHAVQILVPRPRTHPFGGLALEYGASLTAIGGCSGRGVE